MKTKNFITLTVVLLLLSIGAFSQTSSSKAEKIKTLMKVTGAEDLPGLMLKQLTVSLLATGSKNTIEFLDAFKEEMNGNELMLQITPIYEKYYTEADLDGLIAFYQTDLGKKMTKNLPAIMQESMKVGQTWGRAVGERAMKKVREAQEKTKTP